MILFFFEDLSSPVITLPPEESRHCIKVLRLNPGDNIYLTDGKGKLAKTSIIDPNPKKCLTEIVSVNEILNRRNYTLHLAVAPTKNIGRFEWFLEKATEIGIDEITPLICTNSERKIIKPDRLNKILIAAMKQSLGTFLPRLNDVEKFDEFIVKAEEEEKYIAYCENIDQKILKDQYQKNKSCLILIGPEGDFTQGEVQMALDNNYKAVSLGKSRLRTETAAIVACHTINIMNE